MAPKVPKRQPAANTTIHPIAPRVTLFPRVYTFAGITFRLTRRRCEDALLLGAVVWGIFRLGYSWNERALAGEISTLLVLSVAYTAFRFRPTGSTSGFPSPLLGVLRPQSPSLVSGFNHLRERGVRRPTSIVGLSGSNIPQSSQGGRDESQLARPSQSSGEDDHCVPGIGGRGCIWGTEEREYRDCLDDGALFALLLAPLIAAAMLHASLSQLSSNPQAAILPGWAIEPPLVIPTTPIRLIASAVPLGASEAVRALSALAIARRNLVQLFTLLSFVLLVQLARSLRHELILAHASSTPINGAAGAISGSGASNSPLMSSAFEHDVNIDISARPSTPGTYWLRRGEWKRNISVIGFAFCVTGCCVVVKIVTAHVGQGVWSDMSHSDIVIATLFYQFSLYVCVRLARRGFTLGELGLVCHAATALFMETVNMTRMKIPILRTPYIKTYRLPTPLLTFQLALIPGSLLTGFLLSPLLYLSRHLAQRPARRLRFPHEKPMHRRLLALGFYAGTVLVCTGVVGVWARWCLDWRDPWFWAAFFVLDGKHAWTRPALLAYWGALAMLAVAGWQRQLSRARRHRVYLVPGARGEASSTSGNAATAATVANGPHTAHPDSLSGVATQMMDAADMRIPTLSVNARRKSFHALAVVMFIPGIAVDPAFTHLSFSVAFAAFTFAEYVRYFALWPLGASVHLFLNEFIDHKDSGTAILSHFYLLAGCAAPLWLEGPSEIMSYFGVLSLGIGDALASIVGRRLGQIRWSPAFGKTIEGSAAFFASVIVASAMLWAVGAVSSFRPGPYATATALATLLEAFSAQNDNLILPMYGWAVGTLLGV